jgi:hypothetical protein
MAMISHNQKNQNMIGIADFIAIKHIGWRPLISSRVQEQSTCVQFSLELLWSEDQSYLRPFIILCLVRLSSHFLTFVLRAYHRLMHFNLIRIYHDSFLIRISIKHIDQHFPNPIVSPSAKPSMYIFPVSKSWKEILTCHSYIQESNYRIDE